MIHLFATDLDGTFMNADHTTDPYILERVRHLQKQGYILSAATGRALFMTPKDELPGFYWVCMNGAYVADPQGNTLAGFPIDPAIVQEIYEKFPDMPMEFNTLEHLYLRHDQETALAIDQKFRKPDSGLIPPKRMKNFLKDRIYSASLQDVLQQPVYKINCLHIGGEVQTRFEAWLQDHTQDVDNAQSLPTLFELTRAGVNKATGIQALGEQLGISKEEIAVFGDGGNDLDMLKAFEASYAPANACDSAKAAARYHIGHNADYSVIDEMVRIADTQGPWK